MNKIAILATLFASTNAIGAGCDNACLARLLHGAKMTKTPEEQPAEESQEPEAQAVEA